MHSEHYKEEFVIHYDGGCDGLLQVVDRKTNTGVEIPFLVLEKLMQKARGVGETRSFIEGTTVTSYRYLGEDPSAIKGSTILVLDQFRRPKIKPRKWWDEGYTDNLTAWADLATKHADAAAFIHERILTKPL